MTRKAMIEAALKIVPVAARDAIGLVGLAALVHGVTMIYRPAGWIIGGLMLVGYAALSARGGSK